MNAVAFNPKLNHFNVRLNALFSSDIGHWDVPDIRLPVEEAYKLVEEGLFTEEDFRDFVFKNVTELHTQMNPNFFKGTSVEKAVSKLVKTQEIKLPNHGDALGSLSN